ncbi:hypothetical protein [Neobacillus muris]|uniref:hypothetical protein n=1 Tax=Neobacillus muris TaxID=2941334 RepID=UPI00204090E0|nr:hypothetical protein [Neobacillus muris]
MKNKKQQRNDSITKTVRFPNRLYLTISLLNNNTSTFHISNKEVILWDFSIEAQRKLTRKINAQSAGVKAIIPLQEVISLLQSIIDVPIANLVTAAVYLQSGSRSGLAKPPVILFSQKNR